MRVYFYNPNSSGGNFKYATYLLETYGEILSNRNVELYLPQNTNYKSEKGHVKSILLPDKLNKNRNRIFRILYFFYRSVLNPFIFYVNIRKKPKGLIFFNDFDQVTSLIWCFFFKLLRKRHVLSVMLHDPDRDLYFPYKWLSEYSMKLVMKPMHIGFYHSILPKKKYYKNETIYKSVVHGIYSLPQQYDKKFLNYIKEFKGENILLSIIGNLREEKNYELVIEALKQNQQLSLLVAGSQSSSRMDMKVLRNLIATKELKGRVLLYEKYLSDEELLSAYKETDCLVLYYSKTFSSQSGILNEFAPHEKDMIVSETNSALTQQVTNYKLGHLVEPDNQEAISDVFRNYKITDRKQNWDKYIESVSWAKHFELVKDAYLKVNR